MTDVTAVSVLRLVSELLPKLVSGGKAEVKSLKLLIDRKFGEIEKAHKFYMKWLRELNAGAKESLEELERTSSLESAANKLSKVLGVAEKEREKGAVARMNERSEAYVYARHGFRERGILKRVPKDIEEQLIIFMTAYCNYFELDDQCTHALRHSLDEAYVLVNQLGRQSKFKGREGEVIQNAAEDISMLISRTGSYILMSEQTWPRISQEFHKLGLLFREHGLSSN